jgi:hypothetical protein
MLHALKCKFGNVHASITTSGSTGPIINAELNDQSLKLSKARGIISDQLAATASANAASAKRASERARVASAFAKGFPDTADADFLPAFAPVGRGRPEEGKKMAEAFAMQAQKAYVDGCRAPSLDDPQIVAQKAMRKQLEEFIANIKCLEAKYPTLSVFRSEELRYNAKFDSLILKGKADDLKVSRNADKTDLFRERYRTLRDEIIREQADLLAKIPLACKMSLVLFVSHILFTSVRKD